jgi:hypothetical protein
MMETFSCGFSDNSRVTVSFDIEVLKVSSNPVTDLYFEWETKPSPKVIPEYIRWMHTIMSQVAKRTNQRILYIYPSSKGSGMESYSYEKDGSYKRVK